MRFCSTEEMKVKAVEWFSELFIKYSRRSLLADSSVNKKDIEKDFINFNW